MTEDHKKNLQSQLWNIANTLRGKMGADELRDYILGFIFYKYLSERLHMFADEILKNDGIAFDQIDEASADGKAMLEAIQENSVARLGYFLKPSELFHKVAEKGSQKTALVHESELARNAPHPEAPHLPISYDSGPPRSVIRFRMLHASSASALCPPGVRARRPVPMIDLYLKKAFST